MTTVDKLAVIFASPFVSGFAFTVALLASLALLVGVLYLVLMNGDFSGGQE
jgi:hypothetical protein